MAYASQTVVASGSTPNVTVPFPYINKEDVHVSLDGVVVDDGDLSWTAANIIQLSETPSAGVSIKVYRNTPVTALSTVYSTPTVLDHRDWNRVLTQLLYVTQEAFDLGAANDATLASITDYVNMAMAAAQEAAEASQASATASAGSASASSGSASTASGAAASAVATLASIVTTASDALAAIAAARATALSDISTARGTALSDVAASAATATAAASLAEKWSSETTDVEVTPGKYSAKHWAQKAAEAVVAGLTADLLPFTPSLTVTSSNVQDAIEEVDAAARRNVRYDTDAQNLTAPQKVNARTNLGLGAAALKALATTADIRSNTNTDAITTDKAWDASKWVPLGNVTGSITIDASTGSRFYAILTGNVTVNVSNLKDGQTFEVVFIQDATGSRTIGWNAKFKWPGGTVPGVTTTASAIALVASCEGTWDPTNIVLGSAWKVA